MKGEPLAGALTGGTKGGGFVLRTLGGEPLAGANWESPRRRTSIPQGLTALGPFSVSNSLRQPESALVETVFKQCGRRRLDRMEEDGGDDIEVVTRRDKTICQPIILAMKPQSLDRSRIVCIVEEK